jgi:hypothetical protein
LPGPNISEFVPSLKDMIVDFADELKQLRVNPEPFVYSEIENIPGGVTRDPTSSAVLLR